MTREEKFRLMDSENKRFGLEPIQVTLDMNTGKFRYKYHGRDEQYEVYVDPEKVALWRKPRSKGGQLIQNVFPELNDEQREFLMMGITPKKWEKMFPEKE